MDIITFKDKLKNKKPVIGTWSHINSPQVVEILGSANLDFIVFDLEHGPHSISSLINLYIASDKSGILPITRVQGLGNSNILKCLDSGSKGIVVPHIDSFEKAETAIKQIYYGDTPENRGVATLTRASMFDMNNQLNYLHSQNDDIISIFIIEDKKGMESIDQICELKGLDVLFIGLYDLNQSLGFKGDVKNLDFIKIFHDLIKKLNKKNIAIGTYAPNAEEAIKFIELGVSFITVNVDGAILRKSYEDLINKIL